MKELIKKLLKNIEQENKIKIIFAVENGSRAWRMESKDSDYDVRFVYSRPLEDYISLSKSEEVLNCSFDKRGKPCSSKGATIDISGFDIFKFLSLLSNSNPTTIEWLVSDIVYLGKQPLSLKNHALNHFNPKSLKKHYKALAENNYTDYILSKKKVTHKKYLYTFRGIINKKYVEYFNEVPNISFEESLNKISKFVPQEISKELKKMIAIKKEGKESEEIENITFMDKYISEFIDEREPKENPKRLQDKDFLNKKLKEIIIHGNFT